MFAFGGAPLVGDRIMRVVYVDETGHSAKERAVIVVGLILEPDSQWRILAERIEHLRGSDVPEAYRDGFVFHSTDLMYGGKYRGSDWTDEQRWDTLEKLVAIPRELRIPLCFGHVTKPSPRDEKPHRESILSHVIAYALCMKGADWFLTNRAGPTEVAMVVAEQRKEARDYIEQAHYWLTNKKEVEDWLPEFMHNDFPITRVKAPPSFASKDVEPLLQIADACAFVIQRHVNAAFQSERFVEALCGSFAHPTIFSRLRTLPGDYGCLYWPTDEEHDAATQRFYSAAALGLE